MISTIRTLKEAVLNITGVDGTVKPVAFDMGIYYQVTSIEHDTTTGYNNIYFADGTKAMGVSSDFFCNYGVPAVSITSTPVAPVA